MPLPTEHSTCCRLPGLLLQGASQGGVLLGGAGRWTGDAVADRVAGMEKPVKCASPFVASGGAVCAATRQQVAPGVEAKVTTTKAETATGSKRTSCVRTLN